MRRTSRSTLVLAVCGGFLGGCPGSEEPAPASPPRLGSLKVTWEFVDSEGESVLCGTLGGANSRVRVGAQDVNVSCGEEQVAIFDRLLVDAENGTVFGVTVVLEMAADRPILTEQSNALVMPNAQVEHHVTVDVDRNQLTQGSIRFEWSVQGLEAMQGCSLIDGHKVQFSTTESSIAQFSREANCEEGAEIVGGLQPGVYEVRSELLDRSGEAIEGVGVSVAQVSVRSGEQSDKILDFQSISDAFGDFYGSWTITGSSAVDACGVIGGDWVDVTLRPVTGGMQGPAIETGTAACDGGEIHFERVRAGDGELRATFILVSELLGPLATQLLSPVVISKDETSSVAVDFQIR